MPGDNNPSTYRRIRMLQLTAFHSWPRKLISPGLALCFSVLPATVFGQSDKEGSRHHLIVGAWKINFVSQTSPPQFQPIPGVITFTSDGTVVESDGGEVAPTVIPGVPTQYGTAGHGVWKRREDGEVVLKLLEIFVFGNNTLSATGTLKFRLKLDDDDAFFGSGTFEFVDPNGNVLASGAENLEGKRIKIE
jgi:hypothetical protein